MTPALETVLMPSRWEQVNRELVAKLLTELEYEELLAPAASALDGGRRACTLALGSRLSLSYETRPRPLGDHRVVAGSITATLDGADVPLPDAAEIVAHGAPAVGADPSTAAGLVQEISMTVLGDALWAAQVRPAASLLDEDPDVLEGELRGHPWIVAAKGRLGFGAADVETYTPEAKSSVGIAWLGVDPSFGDHREIAGLDHATVVREQVGSEGFDRLRAAASAGGLDPDDAVYVPVHPWQWDQRILPLHAGDVARGRIVPLGSLGQRYVALQSIRTLAEAGRPDRRHLKLALSILNTSVYRGLPRSRTLAAPALTDWFVSRCNADPFLQEAGLVLLGEVASVSVEHRAFASIPGVPYQHTEMLGAIWREPVEPHLREGERAITLAALIHADASGASFAEALIARSGLPVGEWVARLHEVTLPPLLHVLYRFGATFSPHAQNCLVVLRDDVPVRLVVKDFVDDAMISSDPLPELDDMPPEVRAALGEGIESAVLSQWIQSGLLVCVHRYLAELLEDRMGFDEAAFWAAARGAVDAYHERFESDLGDRFDLFAFDAPVFVKLCLNRVRILGRGYADDAERPVASATGVVENPLAP